MTTHYNAVLRARYQIPPAGAGEHSSTVPAHVAPFDQARGSLAGADDVPARHEPIGNSVNLSSAKNLTWLGDAA